MATGANATPLGNVHPSLRGKGTQEEKLAAIETAKRVASQLFPGMKIILIDNFFYMVIYKKMNQ